MKKLLALAISTVAGTLVHTSVAQANVLKYDLSGPIVASFTVDSGQAANPFRGNTTISIFYNASKASVNGMSVDPAHVVFGISSFGGGFSLYPNLGNAFAYNFDGPQLFSGSVTSPTLLTGIYSLTSGFQTTSATYSLNIQNVTTSVPELAAWAMMIAGFGVAGCAMRHRRDRLAASFA